MVKKNLLLILEHSISTELQLVGLQVWRGAFLLADYIFDNPKIFKNKNIIELGSGVGLTSIVASMLAHKVTCTGKLTNIIKFNYSTNKNKYFVNYVFF